MVICVLLPEYSEVIHMVLCIFRFCHTFWPFFILFCAYSDVLFVLRVNIWMWNLDYSKAIDHKTNAFEMWRYRRMLRISWTSLTTNIDVLLTVGVKETTMINNLKNRNMSCAGHNNEKHIRTLWYSDDNNRRKTGRQTRKRETKTDMGRRYKRMDWLEAIRPDKNSSWKEKLTGHICNPL